MVGVVGNTVCGGAGVSVVWDGTMGRCDDVVCVCALVCVYVAVGGSRDCVGRGLIIPGHM